VTYQGADSTMVDAAVAAGARHRERRDRSGYPTPGEVGTLGRATEAGVVVARRRAGGGRVPGAVAHQPGLARGGRSPAWKARVLLRLALAAGVHDLAALQALFDGD
jgi:L-asparaginase/Glu-tRNA(Gln) amidotransferase subunit D